MATVLVTGGVGYVGAHCCAALARAGHTVVAYDNLSNGHRAFAKFGAFEAGDIRDRAALEAVLRRHGCEVVVHCAALIEVGQSVFDPAPFYDVNVGGSLALLAACRASGVRGVVFSSTCAIYGAPQTERLDESHPQVPLNPYGWTKLMVERALWDHQSAYGLGVICLRYFNAAGAAPDLGLGERHEPETHAIPLALASARGLRGPFSLFGTDYPTRDGTCVRDYVHVLDLADAHVRAVERLVAGGAGGAFNLGTGTGTTVLELLAAIEQLTGRPVPVVQADRRPGDSPALVADAGLATEVLGWRPQRSLADIVTSAWVWHTKVEPALFPDGRS